MNLCSLIEELQRIKFVLNDIENCEDGGEMISISQSLACDIESLEDKLMEEGVE